MGLFLGSHSLSSELDSGFKGSNMYGCIKPAKLMLLEEASVGSSPVLFNSREMADFNNLF